MSKSNSIYIPVYATTLLLSAFLLFLVQPMFGKMILPLLGGSPAVWNTAMLFFQALLLAGYAYAHGTAKIMSIRLQALLHLALLLLFVVVLPIAIPEGTHPPPGEDPTFWQLGIMALVVGGPFFVLSGSAPILQHWFAHTPHEDSDNPYFLYAASNLGSMTALIAYPFLVEPIFNITSQANIWAYGYGALICLVLLSALLAWKHAGDESMKKETENAEPITWKQRGLWLLLAFIPSSLMLGVTTYITTDLASMPLLWIVPLALYVGTFIIVFAKKPHISADSAYHVQGLLIIILLGFAGAGATLPKVIMVLGHLGLFFYSALVCHHDLAASRPHAKHLTQFYLIMSLGGALGGFFNAIIAPKAFVLPLEYGIVLALAIFMRESLVPEKSLAAGWARFTESFTNKEKSPVLNSGLFWIAIVLIAASAHLYIHDFRSLKLVLLFVLLTTLTLIVEKRWVLGWCAVVIVLFHPPGMSWGTTMFDKFLHYDRNFFGIIRVADAYKDNVRILMNGTTIHGSQAIPAEHKMLRLSYYSEGSGIGDAMDMIKDFDGEQKVATLGLGVGVTACFQQDGRSFDFFEIDPNVVEVAENRDLFTYLSDCGSPYEIIMGDARMKLVDQEDDKYDAIIVDVFSSDSIPVHLLTYEAFELYKQKTTDNGIVIINISNRYLDLKPVIANIADVLKMGAFNKVSADGELEGMPYHQADFVVMTKSDDHAKWLLDNDWDTMYPAPEFRSWTDQYSNIVGLLKIFGPPQTLRIDPETAKARAEKRAANTKSSE